MRHPLQQEAGSDHQALEDGDADDGESSGSHNESTEHWSPELERRKDFWAKYKVPLSKHMQPAEDEMNPAASSSGSGRVIQRAIRVEPGLHFADAAGEASEFEAEDPEEEELSEPDPEVDLEGDEAIASDLEHDAEVEADMMASDLERDGEEPVRGAGGESAAEASAEDDALSGAAAMEDFEKQLQEAMEPSPEDRYNPEGKAEALSPCGFVFGNERYCTGPGCRACLKALQHGPLKRVPACSEDVLAV